MKKVDIISNIVARKGEALATPSKDISKVNLSGYLLKSIWDKVFEIRTDSQGTEYIFGKIPVVTQYGITMYAGEGVDIPSLASGLPFDGRTIWYNPDTQQIEVIGGTGGGSGEGVSNFWDLSGIPSWITNSKPKYTYSEIEGTPDLTQYALASQIPSLSGYATESWVTKQNYATKATTLSGYGITDAYTKTNVDYLLLSYVTLGGTPQTITGEKNFTGGLKVNGSPIYYDTEKKYWKLEGDLLVTGGVTMYGSDSSFTPSTIMDAIVVDGTTISKSGGVLKVIGGTGGGVADSVAWDNITEKPTWIGSSKPTYSYSEIKGAISTTDLQNYLTQNSYLNVTSGDNRYLKLSGGTISLPTFSPLNIVRESTEAAAIGFHNSTGKLGNLGFNDTTGPKWFDTSYTEFSLLHSGNYSQYALPLSGGTITGTLAVNENLGVGGAIINKKHYLFARDNANADWIVTNKNWGAEYKLWHSGNDGSGSTLDADLLDGKHLPDILASNVASATKLQTARTIWGQSFDGTGNVSGELALGSSYITGFQGTNILDAKSSWVILGEGANAKGWTTYINGYNINMRCGSGSSSAMYIDSSLNIGVKTTTPSYNFDVNGTLNATTIYQNGTTLANTYLSLSGGTLSGNLTIQNKTVDVITLYRDDLNNSPSIKCTNKSDGTLGYIGVSGSGSGIGIHPFFMDSAGTVNKLWHSGNDGSGSGLDADKLDGVEYQNILERGYSGAARCSGVGWHRIGEFKGTDSNIILLIHRLYGNNAPESYAFSITRVMGTDNYCITQLSGTYSTQIITSIRIDIDWDKNGYIDFYYNTTSGNSVCWTIIGGATAYTAATFNPTTLSVQKTITPIKGFQTSGDILSHGGVTMYSMRSLKNVVDERGLSLSELSTIKPTRYTWKDGRDNRLHFGGIADDIQQVLPEVVYSTSDGILTMDYGNAAFAVASSLIKPVVDHEKRIAMLQERIVELEEEVERFKSA